jgi:hypothetical protein
MARQLGRKQRSICNKANFIRSHLFLNRLLFYFIFIVNNIKKLNNQKILLLAIFKKRKTSIKAVHLLIIIDSKKIKILKGWYMLPISLQFHLLC